MNKAHPLIIVTTTLMMSCADSGTSAIENTTIIGTWRRIDTSTVNIADSLGNIVGTSHRTLTNDYIFNKDYSLLSKTKCEYFPQFNYPKVIANNYGKITSATDTIYRNTKSWQMLADTLILTDTIYPLEMNNRTFITKDTLRYSISNNVLILKYLLTPLKVDIPVLADDSFQRVN